MNHPISPQTKKAVAYYRVSTDRQGESRLGLEAQETSVHTYTKSKDIVLEREFTEIESGKKQKRPLLQEALDYCKKNSALLIIAKLDRLGRNVAFISSLMESKVDFVAVDYPEASRLVLHILAAFAEYEREQISIRTKLALQAAKRKGIKLGQYGKLLALHNKLSSKKFALKIKPIIKGLKSEGHTSIQAITNELNKRKVATYHGAHWHKSTVHKIIKTYNV